MNRIDAMTLFGANERNAEHNNNNNHHHYRRYQFDEFAEC